MAKYDWQAIKEEYVLAPDEASRPTLDELAAKHGCSPSYLRERAGPKQENWKMEADRYLQTVQSKRQDQKSTALAGSLAEWDTQCFKVAQAGLMLIFSRLKELHEEVRDYEEESRQPPRADEESPRRHPVNFKALDEMSRSLERLQKVGKAALGEEEKLNIKIDYNNLSDEQLHRLAAGEDPRHVLVT